MTEKENPSTLKSLRFQREREIDAFAFRYVKPAGREEFPILRRVRKRGGCDGRGQHQKPRTGYAHELCSATFVQGREKTINARPKIPDQTWLGEFDRSKLHVRLQRRA